MSGLAGRILVAVPLAVLAIAHAVLLRRLPHGDAIIVDILVGTFVGDTGAYLGGRSFGTRRLAPRISPSPRSCAQRSSFWPGRRGKRSTSSRSARAESTPSTSSRSPN